MNVRRLALVLAIMLFTVPAAFAAIEGATVAEGTTSRLNASTAGTVSVSGGNVTEVNVSGTSITGRWAGLYGEISGGISLGDSGGNTFYDWTVSSVTGAVVFVSNDTTSFGNVSAATNADLPSFIVTPATDNFSNTFSSVQNFTNSTTLGTVENVSYTTTNQNSTQTGVFETYALADANDNAYIFAGVASADAQSYDDATTDYQILAPADSTPVTYYFYVELP